MGGVRDGLEWQVSFQRRSHEAFVHHQVVPQGEHGLIVVPLVAFRGGVEEFASVAIPDVLQPLVHEFRQVLPSCEGFHQLLQVIDMVKLALRTLSASPMKTPLKTLGWQEL